MAAVSATTFLGGVAGVGALRSLGGDKYKDSKKEDDDDDDGKKYWEEEDPKSKSFDKIIEFKKNELDKMFNFKKNKVDKLIKLKKDKLFFPLLPKLKDKVDKIKDAVKDTNITIVPIQGNQDTWPVDEQDFGSPNSNYF